MIKSSSLTSGGEMMVGSVLKVEYSDEAVWELRITEISERTSTVAYEVVSTEPTLDCTSIMVSSLPRRQSLLSCHTLTLREPSYR